MSIDFTKPLQTRDGKKVRLLCTDAREPYPVVVLYEDTKDVGLRTSDGKCLVGISCAADLMNVPEQVTVDGWVNVYRNKLGFIYFGHVDSDKRDAVFTHDFIHPIATIHIKRTVPVGHVDE